MYSFPDKNASDEWMINEQNLYFFPEWKLNACKKENLNWIKMDQILVKIYKIQNKII